MASDEKPLVDERPLTASVAAAPMGSDEIPLVAAAEPIALSPSASAGEVR